jgi:hypothetical protein
MKHFDDDDDDACTRENIVHIGIINLFDFFQVSGNKKGTYHILMNDEFLFARQRKPLNNFTLMSS